jgi:hypothetical protein
MNDSGAAEARLEFTGRENNNEHKKRIDVSKGCRKIQAQVILLLKNCTGGKNYFQPEAIALHLTDHFS